MEKRRFSAQFIAKCPEITQGARIQIPRARADVAQHCSIRDLAALNLTST